MDYFEGPTDGLDEKVFQNIPKYIFITFRSNISEYNSIVVNKQNEKK